MDWRDGYGILDSPTTLAHLSTTGEPLVCRTNYYDNSFECFLERRSRPFNCSNLKSLLSLNCQGEKM